MDFFSSVFTRQDVKNIPKAKDMETEEMPDVQFTRENIKKKI
jgi:hypothetical protein